MALGLGIRRQDQVWVVQVEDARLVIEAETGKNPSPGTRAEIDALVESIKFE